VQGVKHGLCTEMWTVHWDIQSNEGESNRRRGELPKAGLHDLCCSPRIVRAIKSEMMGELKNVFRILMSKRKGRRPLGRPWLRLGYTIKIDRAETGWYSPGF